MYYTILLTVMIKVICMKTLCIKTYSECRLGRESPVIPQVLHPFITHPDWQIMLESHSAWVLADILALLGSEEFMKRVAMAVGRLEQEK